MSKEYIPEFNFTYVFYALPELALAAGCLKHPIGCYNYLNSRTIPCRLTDPTDSTMG